MITKWEKGDTGAHIEETHKPAKTIVNKERDHHKLYSKHGTASSYVSQPSDIHRASYSGHQANRTSFNIFGI